MSAPITAYRKKSFFTRYNNTNVEHLIAIIQQSDAIHLSRFYLDGYMPVRLDDGKEGGIGYVIIGGENATMHNLNKRGGSQRMRVGGDVVQLLNDGGLNTLAQSGIPASALEGTGVVVSVDKPSYYNGVTQANLVYRRTSQQTWYTVQYQGDLNAGTYYFPVGDVPGAYPIPANVEIEAYMILANEEGSMVGDKNTFTVQADLIPTQITFTGYEFVGSTLVIFVNSDKTAVNNITGTVTDQNTLTQNFTIETGQNNVSVQFPNYSETGSNSFFLQNVNGGAGHNVTTGGNLTVFPPAQLAGLLSVKNINVGSSQEYQLAILTSGGNEVPINRTTISVNVTLRRPDTTTQTFNDVQIVVGGNSGADQLPFRTDNPTYAGFTHFRFDSVEDAPVGSNITTDNTFFTMV